MAVIQGLGYISGYDIGRGIVVLVLGVSGGQTGLGSLEGGALLGISVQ
jgi:hypothetical protein